MRSAVVFSLALAAFADCVAVEKRQATTTSGSSSSTNVPEYFQTSPELWAGPTPTGEAPFLAETNVAPFPSVSYIPNSPLETQVPIFGRPSSGNNIFQLQGQLSHYFPNPDGFGVDEYALPPGTNITQLHMLSRHGSRYPTTGSGVEQLAEKIKNGSGKFEAQGQLEFLSDWEYKLGAEILVPVGKQELFESGTLHYYQYGHLYPNNGSKIIARSTTQDRMTQSAEYFLAGFFGLGWANNATLELIIEQNGFNNTLAGYDRCTNSNAAVSAQGNVASNQWVSNYLADATTRLKSMLSGDLNWTLTDTYNAQSLCAYETVALGFSHWCGLFTYAEWEGYEYSIDLAFAGNNAFQSPTGRAVGVGYVQEIVARLQHHLITEPTAQVNVTLDSSPVTFPLDQALNFDFSHDTNIMSILTAFGLKQFAPLLPPTEIARNRSLIVSHVTPFATRLDIEIIKAPKPVNPDRSAGNAYVDGDATTYVHFILNQRTVPLGVSLEQCRERDDGWCEIGAFLDSQKDSLDLSKYEYACNGNYSVVPYGTITDGAPL